MSRDNGPRMGKGWREGGKKGIGCFIGALVKLVVQFCKAGGREKKRGEGNDKRTMMINRGI